MLGILICLLNSEKHEHNHTPFLHGVNTNYTVNDIISYRDLFLKSMLTNVMLLQQLLQPF